jgi:transketolase
MGNLNKMNQLTNREFAQAIREKALEMVYKAKSSHIGGAFSMADILAVLYNGILKVDPKNPDDPSRDRFVLSKGHACSGLYAALGIKGFFPIEELADYAQDGSRLLSHTSHFIPGVEISSGSLGHGLPIATGLAIAAKAKRANWNTYCLISDGELDEGSNWEAFALAPQLRLDNLIVIVDYNKIQSLGFVKDVIDMEPLVKKFEAFRWRVTEIDGHSYNEIHKALKACELKDGVPNIIIAHTVKGKGVNFMENKLLWHYKSPNEKELSEALVALKATGKKTR